MKLQTDTPHFFLFLIAIIVCSCKKHDGAAEGTPQGPGDVYVVGTSAGKNGSSMATLWKNGQSTALWYDTFACWSVASAVKVVDTNIYIAGVTTSNERCSNSATWWLNGIVHHATNTACLNSFALAMAVSGADVYMAGAGYNAAAAGIGALAWKNGDPINLGNYSNAMPYGIAVAGSSILVAGSVPGIPGGGGSTAYLWKNGNGTPLSKSDSRAVGISVSGNDVYVAGDERVPDGSGYSDYATVWKNGVAKHMGLQSSMQVYAIFVVGNDVYLAGITISNGRYIATYWKNDTPVYVSDDPTSGAAAIYVSGNDVYTAGFIATAAGPRITVYWKNKTLHTLDGTTAYGIFVK